MSKIIVNKSNWIEKVFIGLLVVLNALFLWYWVALSANYCLHYDDVHFMWKMQEYSIFEYVKEMYMTRGGNFVGYGLNGVMFTLFNWIGDYHLAPIICYIIGIAMAFGAMKGLLKGIEHWKVLLGVVTLYNIYILTVPDYAVFTWLCAMAYFLYGPAMCLWLRYINMARLNVIRWIILLVLALFLSGSNVTITPMVWLLMLANALWIWKQNGWNFGMAWKDKTTKRIVYLTLGMLVAYAIMFAAPGNFARFEDGVDMNHPTSISQFAVAWVKCIAMFLYFMAFYLPYHLMAVGLGYLAGTRSQYAISNKWKSTAMIIGAFIIYLGVAVIPLAYLSNGFGIQRNYTHLTFFYIMMWGGVGYILGCGNRKQLKGSVLCLICNILLIVVMAVNIKIDLPLAKAYNQAHKERFAYLLQLQKEGNKDTVVVAKYPDITTIDAKYVVCSWLGKQSNKQAINYESDAKVEPNEYEFHIKKWLGLDFDFVLAENPK